MYHFWGSGHNGLCAGNLDNACGSSAVEPATKGLAEKKIEPLCALKGN